MGKPKLVIPKTTKQQRVQLNEGYKRKTLPHLEKVGKANKSTTLQGVITFFIISYVVVLGIILTVIALT
jgi:hypothetical protein